MKRKYILLVFMFFVIIFITPKCKAVDLDEIINYVVTVDPRMTDGSLDITYEITWKVLDSTTEGPLSWVSIGTPNSYFKNPTALSNNIKSINSYNGSYVRIDFNREYKSGESVKFKYSINQPYIHKVSGGKCNYEFTPAWFTDIRVDNLKVKWNKDKVKSDDSNRTEDNYLVWQKESLGKGEKLTVKVKYDKSAFSSLSTHTIGQQYNSYNSESAVDSESIIILLLFFVFIAIIAISSSGGGYYSHRGFVIGHGGYYSSCVHHSSCAHSSCACACAHSSCASSCACACAGSGRAGCSKKDFYGTNLTSQKIRSSMR